MTKLIKSPVTADKILELWKFGKVPDWRPLETEHEKHEWLRACLDWTGLPTTSIGKFNYRIDSNQVVEEIDFYCLIGEVFFGYRGYFGFGPHAFEDCFIEIYNHVKGQPLVSPGARVTIVDHQHLADILNESYPTHFSNIIEVFTKYGFEVNLE
ncbi:hypothetical protein Q0590_36670 [Rhodocytophaga aerolata]|uniref:Barstar family protein n=1 Tax=Rhodocytophaga aerolata TaxID=455078 RepID=A0ABT8RIC8_9BACT|nr:hypothetical protein [Rhodocytophaga aerolata]MDO1451861.1 hypothetical protein [Rhodocytophaga aerolata]